MARSPQEQDADQRWLRWGYAVIGIALLANLLYLASGKIGLSEDEAYQWTWSKHLALSYYSKPPLIALTQFLGTHLWGDTVFGVRFFSPVIAALTALALLRFMARVVNARAAFWLLLIMMTVPLLAVGSVLMTIDPLSVMFWTLAMIAGWRAVQEDGSTRDWLWVGLWMGFGLLSKYTSLFQLLSWAAFFVLWPSARKQLRRPGFWLALLINALCAVPILIWNSQNGWITIHHVAQGGHFDEAWSPTPGNLWHGLSHYTLEFAGEELGLLNPCYVLPAVWAAVMFWRRHQGQPLPLYFFCMGAPIFICYGLFTLHSRVLPNWIAPSIVPFLCLATLYWEARWRAGGQAVKCWLGTGLALGGIATLLVHDIDLISVVTRRPLPESLDVMKRVEAWEDTARVVEAARQTLLAEGKPVFIIGAHYNITGQLSFNLPAARASIQDQPLVYYRHSKEPDNQFYFWPGYSPGRRGQNALFVQILGEDEPLPEVPGDIVEEFESVKNLGEFRIMYRGRLARKLMIVECRGLR